MPSGWASRRRARATYPERRAGGVEWTLGDILGFAVILGGLAICIALWWLMVWRPSREERRARAASEAARSHDPRADGPGSSV